MKAARLHEYHEALKVEEIDEPKILGPLDVIVKIGAAGLCRTDLHIQEGQWAEKSGVDAALHARPRERGLGARDRLRRDQRRGRRHRDRPSVHLLRAVPAVPARATTCTASTARSRASGATAASRSSCRPRARSVVKLDPSLHPTDIAALADAGLTAIHAVKKAIPILGAGTKAVVIGAGGLGHIGIQCLKAYTPTEIIVIDPSEKALALAERDRRRPDGEGRRHAARHGRRS